MKVQFAKYKIEDPEGLKQKEEEQKKEDQKLFLRCCGIPEGYLWIKDDECLNEQV